MRFAIVTAVLGCGHPSSTPLPSPRPLDAAPADAAAVAPPLDAAAVAPPLDAGPPDAAVAATPPVSTWLVEWGGAGGFGSGARLTIDQHGDVRDEFFDGRGHTTTTRGHLSKAELAKLGDGFAKHQLCALVADPKYVPVPEEHTTRLTVQLPPVSCSVELHSNEWFRSADGKAIAQAIEAIRARLR